MAFDYYVSSVVNFISSLSSPVQIFLLVATVFVIRKLVASKVRRPPPAQDERLEPLKKRDFTLEELREYDGVKQKRVLLAINGNVFDVTRGKDFYGPGGPYSVFAGRDASRGLATFSVGVEALKDEYDDTSDFNNMQIDSLREWEAQFREKYDLVGKLLKPGEKPQNYEESETEPEDDSKKEK